MLKTTGVALTALLMAGAAGAGFLASQATGSRPQEPAESARRVPHAVTAARAEVERQTRARVTAPQPAEAEVASRWAALVAENDRRLRPELTFPALQLPGVDGPIDVPTDVARRDIADASAEPTPTDVESPDEPAGPPPAQEGPGNAPPSMEGPLADTVVSAPQEAASESPAPAQPATPAPSANTRPDGAAKPTVDEAQPEPAAAVPARELSKAEMQLRDRMRRVLAAYAGAPLSLQEATVTEVLGACLSHGCATQVIRGGKPVNAVAALCWNLPCGGYQPLAISREYVTARVGYGQQTRPGQMLATFAFARVPPDYGVRIGEHSREVADLVRYEMLDCREGADAGMKLIGLSFYVDDATWKNDRGDEWSLSRLLKEELDAQTSGHDGGTARLLALSFALQQRAKRQGAIDGEYARAERYVRECEGFAFRQQNGDGSWSSRGLAGRGTARDAGQFRTTAQITEWLCVSLPDERLGEPAVVKAVENVLGSLASRHPSQLKSLSNQDGAVLWQALHALSLYDDRYFKPCDPPPSETPAKTAAKPQR